MAKSNSIDGKPKLIERFFKRYKKWQLDIGIIGGEITLGFVLYLWFITNVSPIFKGIIFGMMELLALMATKVLGKLIDEAIVLVYMGVLCAFKFNIKNHVISCTYKIDWSQFRMLLGISIEAAIVLAILMFSITKYDIFLFYPTTHYYKELMEERMSDVIDDKLKLEKEKSNAKEIKRIIIGLYALIVGTIISFGVDLIKYPLSNEKMSNKVADSFLNASGAVLEFALSVWGLLILLQAICHHFEMVTKRRIKIIDQYIEYKQNLKEYIGEHRYATKVNGVWIYSYNNNSIFEDIVTDLQSNNDLKDSKKKKRLKRKLIQLKAKISKYKYWILALIVLLLLGVLIVNSKGKNLGSLADWVSAFLSALAIYFVYWQVNRQMKNEKILKTEFSRPIFSFNLISDYHDNVKTYIPNNGDIQVLRNLCKDDNVTLEGNILRYNSNYSVVTPFTFLNRVLLISNPSTQPMLFVKVEVTFKNNKKGTKKDENKREETFRIGRINENESAQILPDRFIQELKDRKRVDEFISYLDIEKVKLFFTTVSNEKFMYSYVYENDDLNLKEHRKVVEDDENGDYYKLYLFDQDPYIIFKAY